MRLKHPAAVNLSDWCLEVSVKPMSVLLVGLGVFDLRSALKETLNVFLVSANWAICRAAGLQQPASAAVNIKQSQRALIASLLCMLSSVITCVDKALRQRLNNKVHQRCAESL